MLRVLSDDQGALCHLTLQYVDWLALQLLPDTAETEWLDRHGQIWLINADGSKGRKLATLATGTASFVANIGAGAVIPAGTQLQSGVSMPVDSDSPFQTMTFETLADITTSTGAVIGDIRALDAGSLGNLPSGTTLSVSPPIPGLDVAVTVVDVEGGVDTETDDQLRRRVLARIQNPPMGGDANDYVQWALAVPGVTRAWQWSSAPGTITVFVMFDDLRANNDGFPEPQDLPAVVAYIDQMRPVTVKEFFVLGPTRQFFDVTIANLMPNTDEAKAEIEQSLRDMLFDFAAPGQTIFAAWINFAIMNASSVFSFDLVTTDDIVMQSPGHMAVLGTILYE